MHVLLLYGSASDINWNSLIKYWLITCSAIRQTHKHFLGIRVIRQCLNGTNNSFRLLHVHVLNLAILAYCSCSCSISSTKSRLYQLTHGDYNNSNTFQDIQLYLLLKKCLHVPLFSNSIRMHMYSKHNFIYVHEWMFHTHIHVYRYIHV